MSFKDNEYKFITFGISTLKILTHVYKKFKFVFYHKIVQENLKLDKIPYSTICLVNLNFKTIYYEPRLFDFQTD